MKKYTIKNHPGFYFNHKKANEYGERLANLKKKNGLLNAEIVVNDAQKKTSPYHSEFIWDNTEAADKWRLHTARNLIGSIQIEIEEFESPVRLFESVIIDDIKQYEDIETIAENKFLINQVINDLKTDLSKLRMKYRRYTKLKEYFDKAISMIDEYEN